MWINLDKKYNIKLIFLSKTRHVFYQYSEYGNDSIVEQNILVTRFMREENKCLNIFNAIMRPI